MQLLLTGVSLGLVYALVGQGLNVTFWTLGVINFAHGAFLMFATYIALRTFESGVPIGAAIVIALVTVAMFGIVVERVAVRPVLKFPGGMGWVVATFGAAIIMESVAAKLFGTEAVAFPHIVFSPTDTVHIGEVALSSQVLLVGVVALGMLGGFELLLRRSTWGMRLRATRHDPDGASLVGISVKRMVSGSFAISGALAGVAGVLVAPISGISPAFGFAILIKGFAAVVIGGMGSSTGALVGGVLVGVTELLVAGYISSALRDGVAFAILIVILMVLPNGLLGRSEAERV